MNSAIISILSIYIFIVIGFIAKRSFKEKIDNKTINLINIYFFQIFLTFWGLLIRPIDMTFFYVPVIYAGIVFIMLFISALLAKKLFYSQKERSIATISPLIGNTGNLGIPLCIAIFGEASIPYATIINLINVFIVYTFGVYYYSRGNFDMRESIKNIFKLPILWAAVIAILLSINGFKPDGALKNVLTMGAYTSMSMQLFLFGVYLYGVKIKEIDKKLLSYVILFKFLLLPMAAFLVLYGLALPSMTKAVIFIELIMPLAVANLNLSILYDCMPKVATTLVFITSALFLVIVFVATKIIAYF